LISELSRRRVKTLLITEIKNIRYLTGFQGSTALLLVANRELFFITDFRYKEQSIREVKGCSIIVPKGSLLNAVRMLLKKLGLTALAFEKDTSFRIYDTLRRDFTLRPLDAFVERLRQRKDKKEIESIMKAVQRAESAFLKVKRYIRAGVTERAIALRLEEAIKREGANQIPFDVIVASGENSALPHARPTDRRLRPGDLLIVDWGAEADGYFSDMTRTFLLRGGNTEKKREIYRIVLKANQMAIKAVKPGLKARDVDSVARGFIRDSGYGDFFGHGTGHGVGLDIHESPRLSFLGKDILEDGMVFTIEPGIYLSGVGGVRIEDMVYLKKGKPRVLTRLGRRLEIL
jgi:Xaa-Pro aminopeptidase